MLPANGKSR